jgi:hypothetical protein
MTRITIALFVTSASLFAAAKQESPVTFHKDVAPILRANCQGCHRPGEIAPMSFGSYSEVRPWAEAIKESVLLKRMPPWFADPNTGVHFKNDRSLNKTDIDTLVRWAESGAREGDRSEARQAAVEYREGWNIAEPDLVFEMSRPFEVPASGEVDYQYHLIPSGFTEDTWVQASEIRPGNREVVHHVIVYVRPPGSTYLDHAKPGGFYVPDRGKERAKKNSVREMFARFTPGYPAEELAPGRARLVPAGSDFIVQLHYTPTGKPQTDLTKFGLVLATETPTRQVKTMSVVNGKFVIPPGAPNHQVDAVRAFKRPLEVLSLKPHMHLRGKAFEFRLVRADGSRETLLSVPHYDFNWQLSYELAEPLMLAKGDKLEATGWYDNSPNNPANPDPTEAVRWGAQSREEMMIGFFEASFPVDRTAPSDD